MRHKEILTDKIQEYLLYFLIFLLPLQTRWMFVLGTMQGEYWEYGTYSIYAFDIFLIILLFCYFFILGFKFQILNFKLRRLWLLIGGLELFIFISIFFAADFKLALYGYGRFLLGVGLFFLITQIEFSKMKLYWALVLSGAIQSIFAMWQFVAQHVFSNKWLGMAFQSPETLGVSVIETELRRWLRGYGSLPHPNILGGFLAIALLVNIILYFKLWEIGDEKPGNKNKYKILLSLVFIIINTVGLALTFSRAAWLAFTVGFVLLIPWATDKYKKWGAIMITKIILIIFLTVSMTVAIFNEPFLARFNLQNRLEQVSVTERLDYNKDAWQVIRKNWLFGTGIKNYGLVVRNDVDNSRGAYEYEPVHNVLLLIWTETGILGLGCFVALLFYCFWKLWQKKNFAVMSVLAAITMIMFFDHWLWSMAFGIYLFWLAVGLAVKQDF